MGISIGSSNFVISEANYAANFKSAQHDTYDSAPEQVLKNTTPGIFRSRITARWNRELWLNKNPESHYTGLMMAVEDVKQHFTDEADGTQKAARTTTT